MAKSRRGRGEGGIRQRDDGLWVSTISLGIVDGRRVRKVAYGKTKKEAQDALKALQIRYGVATAASFSDEALGTYLARFLENLTSQVRINTKVQYEYVLKKHVVPRIGGTQLDKLSPMHVQAMLTQMEHEGVSPRVRQLARAVLARALRDAVKMRILPHNPASDVKGPKVPKVEHPLWTLEQTRAFLDAAFGHRLHAFFVLAPYSGMRHGEMLGLKWSDVDLKGGVITVRRTLIEVGQTHELAEPKTKAAHRAITLPAPAVAALKMHRARLLEEGLSGGELVFPTRAGGLMRKAEVYSAFEELVAKAGVPKTRIHDFRHQSATLMIASGADPKTVQARLGHSNIKVTLDTYAHAFQGRDKDVAVALGDIIGGKP